MEIRILQQPELLPALHLVWEVFVDEIAPETSPEGVASFQKFITYDYIRGLWQRGTLVFFGSYDEETLCGTLALRPDGHVALFFVKRQYQGQGIGRKLLRSAYDYCTQYLMTDRMTVNAAPGAAGKYERMGLRRMAGEQERDGVRYVPMEMDVDRTKLSWKEKFKISRYTLGGIAVLAVILLTAVAVGWNSLRKQERIQSEYEVSEIAETDDSGGLQDEVWQKDGELVGISGIPENIDGDLPYEIKEEMYTFSGDSQQPMAIEFNVAYPKVTGLSSASVEKKVNDILKARAMETVNRIYEAPSSEMKERVLAEAYPMLVDQVNYKVSYASKSLLSVVYEDYGLEGGQNYPSQHLRTCNISLKDGRVYEVKDIVNLSDRFLDEWLLTMRRETDNDAFLSELDKAAMKKALEGDSRESVYVANFFLDADGIEIGFDLNYEDGASENFGYIWVTAPFSFDRIKEYATGSDLWTAIKN